MSPSNTSSSSDDYATHKDFEDLRDTLKRVETSVSALSGEVLSLKVIQQNEAVYLKEKLTGMVEDLDKVADKISRFEMEVSHGLAPIVQDLKVKVEKLSEQIPAMPTEQKISSQIDTAIKPLSVKHENLENQLNKDTDTNRYVTMKRLKYVGLVLSVISGAGGFALLVRVLTEALRVLSAM